MNDKEFIASLKNMDNDTLMDNLEDLGGDRNYQEIRSAIIAEIRKRLAVPEREKGYRYMIDNYDAWGDIVLSNCVTDMRGEKE